MLFLFLLSSTAEEPGPFESLLQSVEAEQSQRKLKSRVLGNPHCADRDAKRQVLAQRLEKEADRSRRLILQSLHAYALVHSEAGGDDHRKGCAEYERLLPELRDGKQYDLFATSRDDFLRRCYVSGKRRRSPKAEEFGKLCASIFREYLREGEPPCNQVIMASALMATGLSQNAEKIAADAAAAFPRSPGLLLRAGVVLAEMLSNEAEQYLLAAAKLVEQQDQIRRDAYAGLVRLYSRHLQYEKAMEMQGALIKASGGKEGHVKLAILMRDHAKARRRDIERSRMETVIEEGLRGRPSVQELLDACDLYFEWSEYDKVVELGQRILSDLKEGRETAQQRYLAEIMLGRSLYSLQEKAKAKTYLQRAIEHYPERTPLNMQRLWLARDAVKDLGLNLPSGFPPF